MQSAAVTAGVGALTLGGAGSAAAQSVARENCEGEFAQFEVGGGDQFVMINNDWGNESADQCIYEYDDGTIGWDFCCGSGGINYPEVYLGTRPWGGDTGVPEWHGLTHGSVDELVMEYDLDIDADGQWNLAPEYWLMEGEPGEDPALTHEIMLVCDYSDSHGHGADEETAAIEDQFGNTIDYWQFYGEGGTNADFHIFKLSERSSCGRVDWMEIVEYVDDLPGVRDDLTMTGLELGTEYWGNASGEVHVNTYNVTINGNTYELGVDSDCAGGTSPTPALPSAPTNVSETSSTTDSVTVGWSSAAGADEYDVFLDGGYRTTTSTTSTTLTGLSAGSTYTVGVEATNDAGSSDRTTVTVSTDEDDTEPSGCPVGEGETLSNGNTVCDIDGDGKYRDLTASGDTTTQDLQYFFENQHKEPYDSRTDLFDFTDNGDVGQPDVVDLFHAI